MRRSALGFAAAVAGLLAAPTVASALTAVTTEPVPLRAGPAIDFPIVDSIPDDARVNVHGCVRAYRWCDVSWRDARGWVQGDDLAYFYQQSYVPIIEYGPRIVGLPIISFSIDTYWDRHYRGRPWYRERTRWRTVWRERDGRRDGRRDDDRDRRAGKRDDDRRAGRRDDDRRAGKRDDDRRLSKRDDDRRAGKRDDDNRRVGKRDDGPDRRAFRGDDRRGDKGPRMSERRERDVNRGPQRSGPEAGLRERGGGGSAVRGGGGGDRGGPGAGGGGRGGPGGGGERGGGGGGDGPGRDR